MSSEQMKEVPLPPCKNRTRTTLRCRRMCCRKEDTRSREADAPGRQVRLFEDPNYYRKHG